MLQTADCPKQPAIQCTQEKRLRELRSDPVGIPVLAHVCDTTEKRVSAVPTLHRLHVCVMRVRGNQSESSRLARVWEHCSGYMMAMQPLRSDRVPTSART